MADLLFIVSRAAPKTYMHIKPVADEERVVRVILDRRERERRRSQTLPQSDRRHVERRHRDVTRELQSSGWAAVGGLEDVTRCVEPGCREEGIVGLNGAWLCLTHFDIRFAAMQAARGRASSSRHLT